MNINANTKSSHVIPTNHRKANNSVRKNDVINKEYVVTNPKIDKITEIVYKEIVVVLN